MTSGKFTVNSTNNKNYSVDSYFQRILYIRIIFGYDFLPIKSSLIIKILGKCYCIIISLLTSSYLLYNLDDISMWPYVFVIIEYVVTVFLSCFTRNRHREEFLKNIENLDRRLSIPEKHYKKLQIMHSVIALVAIVTRAVYAASFCFCFMDICSPIKLFIASFVSMGVDVNQLPRTVIFYMCHHQIAILREKMEKKSSQLPTVSQKCVDDYSIKQYLDIYRDILNNTDRVCKVLSPMFFLSLVCCLPKIMLLFYNILLQSKSDVPVLSLVILGIEAIQWGLLPCLPGIVAENTECEVKRIKLHLMNELLQIGDQKTRQDYQDFLQYIEIRPYKHRIWKIVPVDINLPIGLLSLCTTYLIVIIQFTHLFG